MKGLADLKAEVELLKASVVTLAGAVQATAVRVSSIITVVQNGPTDAELEAVVTDLDGEKNQLDLVIAALGNIAPAPAPAAPVAPVVPEAPVAPVVPAPVVPADVPAGDAPVDPAV